MLVHGCCTTGEAGGLLQMLCHGCMPSMPFPEWGSKREGHMTVVTAARSSGSGPLKLTVMRGTEHSPAGTTAPAQYCTVTVGGRKHTSRIVHKTLSPLWDEHYVFSPAEVAKALRGRLMLAAAAWPLLSQAWRAGWGPAAAQRAAHLSVA